MKTKQISAQEIAPLRISALPTRPTAPVAFGGKGYTSAEMKAAFDKLPELIIERFNSLIADVTDGGILGAIPVSIDGYSSLRELIDGISAGSLAAKTAVFDTTLTEFLAALRSDVDRLLSAVGEADK